VVLPIHPRTRKIIQQLNINIDGEQIILIDPVGYLQMVYLIQHADVVMTDSGGLQKEAFFFKKPCLTLRDETEWVELVQHGFNTLVGADSELIVEAFDKVERNLNFEIDLYGGGQAAQEVALNLLNFEA
jgi:UDP-GlcNAc3NAcA epimerase